MHGEVSHAELEARISALSAELRAARDEQRATAELLRLSLAEQTASAEILQAINASPGDLAPVFQLMLDKALELCGASIGALGVWQGERFRFAALRGSTPEYDKFLAENEISPGPRESLLAIARGPGYVQFADLAASKLYERGDALVRGTVDVYGGRTVLTVPLVKDDEVLGVFGFVRREVRPFTELEIAILRSFAAQAVIAMDNARLLDQIRQQQAELRVTLDNMGDGVAMFDAQLRLAAWNRNFQQILDLADAFLASRPPSADFIRYLATRGEYGAVDVEAEVRRLTELHGTQWSAERTRPDGRVVEVRHNPVPGGGFVLIYGDVTERKRAEAEIRKARDAAERALAELKTAQASLIHAEKMASLGQLTAGIAHEIKNPLNFINNFAGLSVDLLDELKETAGAAFATLDASRRAGVAETMALLTGNLGKIVEHGRRADGIVRSMLAHSRGSSGDRQPVDLNALVEEALTLAYHGARAQDQNFTIALERDFAPGIAPVELAPQDVTRVLLNLIGNGFHAAHKRLEHGKDAGFRPTLTVATRELGDAVEIRVRDNGTGIAPEHRDKLFQPFFTTKPTGEGTGLGLSISWDIVTQQHGGTISVESEVGCFAEFTVRLPRTEPKARESLA
jgi:two-component system, NtrC family, sensor kinase